MNFLEETEQDKEYKYKILVYPNITFQSDLERDSYIVVIRNIIKNLRNIRNDLFWTMILPRRVTSLELDNVEQLLYPYPSYPNSMRCHFNYFKMMELLDWKNNEWDIVYSHLPEHTLQLKNLLYNTTNINPRFIGYTHWTEFPEITNYSETLIDFNTLGLLSMDECGINTIGQKNLVLKNAKTNFNESVIERLKKIVQPHYLGWEIPVYDKSEKFETPVIAFNHRPHAYKSYDWFIKQMDKLVEFVPDLQVWVPLSETNDRPYFFNGKNKTRSEYLTTLSRCWFGVAGKQKYAGWSVSATDGLSVGTPYLFYESDYYRELAGDAGEYFESDESFLNLCRSLINGKGLRKELSDRGLERFKSKTWDKNIIQFDGLISKTIDKFHVSQETDSYKKIAEYIRKERSVSKKEILDYMGWGVRIGFNSYRNRLRLEKDIKLTSKRYEVK